MVRRLTRDGDGVAVVVGQAGTGKTFALAAAREAWEAQRRHVSVGAAVARRAARELEDESRHPEHERHRAARRARSPAGAALPRRAVLVLDEAGMLPTRELARLVEHAARLDAKLVLVGDHRQLPAIEAGGAFRGLATRLPVIELRENRRQVERWERDALALLRDGDGGEALGRYERARPRRAGEDADGGPAAAGRRLVGGARPRRCGDDRPAARRRRRPQRPRARADARRRRARRPSELRIGGDGFAVGDRVVLRRNDRALGVVNGDRGIVIGVDRGAGARRRRARGPDASRSTREYLDARRATARRSNTATRSPATSRKG